MMFVVSFVGIPLPALVAGGGNEAAARFHQTSSQQHTLTDGVQTVGLFGGLGFLGKVKGGSDIRRQDHI